MNQKSTEEALSLVRSARMRVQLCLEELTAASSLAATEAHVLAVLGDVLSSAARVRIGIDAIEHRLVRTEGEAIR